MKQLIREYFTFNKRERNGIFVLLVIILLLIAYLNVADKFIPHEKIDFSKFEKEIQALNKSDIVKNNTWKEKSTDKNNCKSSAALIERFPFNPNHLAEQDWK